MRISDWSSDVCSSDLRHWRLWKPRLDIADQFDAIAIRQAHIGDEQIEALLRQQCTRLLQGANRDGREIPAAARDLDEPAAVHFVIDDQNTGFTAGHGEEGSSMKISMHDDREEEERDRKDWTRN